MTLTNHNNKHEKLICLLHSTYYFRMLIKCQYAVLYYTENIIKTSTIFIKDWFTFSGFMIFVNTVFITQLTK